MFISIGCCAAADIAADVAPTATSTRAVLRFRAAIAVDAMPIDIMLPPLRYSMELRGVVAPGGEFPFQQQHQVVHAEPDDADGDHSGEHLLGLDQHSCGLDHVPEPGRG